MMEHLGKSSLLSLVQHQGWSDITILICRTLKSRLANLLLLGLLPALDLQPVNLLDLMQELGLQPLHLLCKMGLGLLNPSYT